MQNYPTEKQSGSEMLRAVTERGPKALERIAGVDLIRRPFTKKLRMLRKARQSTLKANREKMKKVIYQTNMSSEKIFNQTG